MKFEQIRDEALKLPLKEREQLADAIWESLNGMAAAEISMAELEKRLHEMKTDPRKRVALEEVFPELREVAVAR